MAFSWKSVFGITLKGDGKGLANLTAQTRNFASQLRALGDAFDFTHVANTQAFQLDKTVRELSAQIGEGAEKAQEFADAATGLANATGLSADETGQLVSALAMTGRTITDLDPALKGSTNTFADITNGIAAQSEAMAELVGRYGLTATEAVKSAVDLDIMGSSIGEMTETVAVMQDQFNIPGMLKEMPKAVEFARKSMSRFSKTVTGSGKDMVVTTLEVGAAFSKTYGVGIGQAIDMATEHINSVNAALRESRDVYIGMGKDFPEVYNSFFMAGLGIQEIDQLMRDSREQPEEYAAQVLAMKKQMEDTYGKGAPVVEQFYENVRRNSSAAVQDLLENEGRIDEMRRARKEAQLDEQSDIGAGATAFGKMTKAIRGTGVTAINTFKNLIQLAKTMIGLEFAGDIAEMFADLNKWMKDFNVEVKDMARNLRTSEKFKEWRPVIIGVGKAVIATGAAIGTLSATMAGVAVPLRALLGLFQSVPFAGTGATKALRGFGIVARGLATKILLPLTAVWGLINAFKSFGEALRDPNLTGGQKFVALIRGALVGVAEAFDTLLFGIPSRIAKYFFPQMGDSLSGGLSKMFDRAMRKVGGDAPGFLGNLFRRVRGFLLAQLINLKTYFEQNLDTWKESAMEWGRDIGAAVGQIAVWLKDFVVSLFRKETWVSGWNAIVDFFSGEGEGGNSLLSVLGDLFGFAKDLAIAFGYEFGDEIFRAFGTNMEEVLIFFETWIMKIQNAWDRAVVHLGPPLYIAIQEMLIKVQEAFIGFKHVVNTVWHGIREVIGDVVSVIITDIVGPLVKHFANTIVEILEWKKTLFGTSPELQMQINDMRNFANFSDQWAIGQAAAAQEAIAKSELETKADEEALKARKRNLAEYKHWAEETHQERTDAVEAEIRERERAQKQRNQDLRDRASSRTEERENRKKEAAFQKANLEKNRTVGVSVVNDFLESLESRRAEATERGDTEAAEKFGQHIETQKQILEHIEMARSGAQVQNLMAGAYTGLVRAVGEGAAKGTAAYAQERAQAKITPPEPPMAAPALGGPTGAAGAAKPPPDDRMTLKPPPPQQVNVNVEAHVRTSKDLEVDRVNKEQNHIGP